MKNFTKMRIGFVEKRVNFAKGLQVKTNKTPLIPNQGKQIGISIYNEKGHTQNLIGAFIKPNTVKK